MIATIPQLGGETDVFIGRPMLKSRCRWTSTAFSSSPVVIITMWRLVVNVTSHGKPELGRRNLYSIAYLLTVDWDTQCLWTTLGVLIPDRMSGLLPSIMPE